MPSAPSVCGPTTPSTSSPCDDWNARTALRVWRPNTPSALMPSARWTAIVVAAGSRWLTAPPPPPPPPSAPRVTGPTTPSTSSPCAAWNERTALRVWRPNTPSAAIPSMRWTSATAGPRAPIRRSSPADVPATSVPWARAASLAGASTVTPISAAETSACFLR